MARAAPTLPISPRLFRHFAVITVAITACVAMFADGEGREAIANEVAVRQKQNELLIAEADKVGKRTVGFDRAMAGKGAVAAANDSVDWSDDGGDFGAPIEGGSGSGDGPSALGSRGPIARMTGSGAVQLIPPQARQRGTVNPQPARPPRPTAAQVGQIEEASRIRAGAPE